MRQFLPPLVLTVVCIGLGFFLNSLIWTALVCNNTVIIGGADSSSSSRASSPTRYPTKYPTSTSNTNYPTPDTHSQFSTTFPTALGQVDLGNGWNVCWLTYLLALPFQIGFVFIVLPMWWIVRCRLTISLFLSIQDCFPLTDEMLSFNVCRPSLSFATKLRLNSTRQAIKSRTRWVRSLSYRVAHAR